MKWMRKNPEERRNELIDAAEELFIKNGYEHTSVNNILKKTNLSKGAFYHYFKSKDQILDAVIERFIKLFLREIEKIIDNSNLNALQKFNILVSKSWELKEPRLEMFKQFYYRNIDIYSAYKLNIRVRTTFVPLIVKIVKQGVEEGVFNTKLPSETIDLLIMMQLSLNMFGREIVLDNTKLYRYIEADLNIYERVLGLKEGAIKFI